jgi:hypothetical protein
MVPPTGSLPNVPWLIHSSIPWMVLHCPPVGRRAGTEDLDRVARARSPRAQIDSVARTNALKEPSTWV